MVLLFRPTLDVRFGVVVVLLLLEDVLFEVLVLLDTLDGRSLLPELLLTSGL